MQILPSENLHFCIVYSRRLTSWPVCKDTKQKVHNTANPTLWRTCWNFGHFSLCVCSPLNLLTKINKK